METSLFSKITHLRFDKLKIPILNVFLPTHLVSFYYLHTQWVCTVTLLRYEKKKSKYSFTLLVKPICLCTTN